MNYQTPNIGSPVAGLYTGMQQQQTDAPPAPGRFSSIAGHLESRVAYFANIVERLSKVADRLGGSVPEETGKAGVLRGAGANIAVQLEQSLEDFEALARRAERVVERLESL